MADCAVEIAASTIKKKLETHHKKHCKSRNSRENNNNNNNNDYSQLKDEECTCGQVRLNVEEGKTSTVILSPIIDRKADRREGVSEKNNTERKLVKEAVKVVVRSANMKDFNMM